MLLHSFMVQFEVLFRIYLSFYLVRRDLKVFLHIILAPSPFFSCGLFMNRVGDIILKQDSKFLYVEFYGKWSESYVCLNCNRPRMSLIALPNSDDA